MTTLPTHIGGYQHLQPDVVPTSTDIIVLNGTPMVFVGDCLAFDSVGQLEAHYCGRVYRKIAVTKQGDNDDNWKKVRDGMFQAGPDGCAGRNGTEGTHVLTEAQRRKATPVYSGVLKYFPLALAEVARVSQAGNDQHNPGKPLHWDRSKSGDELDAASRHLLEAGTLDTDGQRHTAKLAWRSLAALQKELETAHAR